MSRVALVFPGQGSQAPGMAGGLLETPLGGELLAEAAACGLELRPPLEAGDAEALRATEIAQPALLLVEASLAALLPAGLDVAAAAGHSVGEYAALVAAGALAPGDAMRLVVERGRAMAAMREGTMVALLGVDDELATAVCAEASALGVGVVVVANLNAPGQVVVSGDRRAVDAAVALVKERGARRATPLNVSGAFHSPLMQPAADRFAAMLDAVDLSAPRFPVVCNVDAEAVDEAQGLRDRLRRQLTSPVRWTASVRRLAAVGAEALVEVGPGAVLTGLAKRIAPGLPASAVGTPAAARSLAASLPAGTGRG